MTSRGEAHPGDAAGGSGGAFGRVFVSDSVAGGGKMVTPRRSDAATAVQCTPPISPDQEWCDVVSKRNRREKKKHAREPEVTTRSECVKKEEDDGKMRRGAETKDGYTFSPPVSEKMLSNQAHSEVSSDFVSQTVSTRWVDRVTGQSDAPRPERMQSRSGGGSSSYGDRSSMEKEKSTEEGSTDSCLEDPESERYKTSGCDLEVSNADRVDRRSEHGFNALYNKGEALGEEVITSRMIDGNPSDWIETNGLGGVVEVKCEVSCHVTEENAIGTSHSSAGVVGDDIRSVTVDKGHQTFGLRGRTDIGDVPRVEKTARSVWRRSCRQRVSNRNHKRQLDEQLWRLQQWHQENLEDLAKAQYWWDRCSWDLHIAVWNLWHRHYMLEEALQQTWWECERSFGSCSRRNQAYGMTSNLWDGNYGRNLRCYY